ncbi:MULTISPECIES: restriction endonuclease subunit S [Deefgea]|uniref:Type I restriction modification DNA specificity domain-containing protein n=1 Tax=Deefgea chitinilytica TaxID=570276 RepID=A0ABS2CE03_9NEIS|nr:MULTISPECIES: restriction endonuclease subunit S [Deefgea]MBM5572272.1 hypothetical protein [Deefgea chitinilytica]MBM9889508.1 restriction endonuclease subunit S [Deefgea sp. CFH1-16]
MELSKAIPQGYKQTEVGMIPEDWKVSSLGELVQNTRAIRYGVVQPGKFDAQGCLMLRSQDYSKGWTGPDGMHRVSLSLEQQYKNAKIRSKDLVMTVVGAGIGQVVHIPNWLDQSILSRSTARIAIDEDKAAPNFIKAFLESTKGWRQILDCQKEGAQPVVSCLDLAKFRVPIPSRTEQQQIATALSDIDALLAQLDALIAKKRDLKQAAMQQLLTAQTRLPGFSGEWEVKRLGDIADFFSGGTPPTSNSAYYGGDIQWITSGDLNQGFIHDVNGRITQKGFENSSAKLVQNGNLLIALYGATAGVVAISKINAAINQAVLAIVLYRDNTDYLYQLLSFLKPWIIKTYTQGGQPNLSGDIVKSIELTLPDLKEQTAIATVLSDMDAEITALEARRDKTRALKQGMMQELLTGRTRLI